MSDILCLSCGHSITLHSPRGCQVTNISSGCPVDRGDVCVCTTPAVTAALMVADKLTRERDEARATCLHGLDVAGRQNDRLTAVNARMRLALDKLSDFRANRILNINQAQDISRAAREEPK